MHEQRLIKPRLTLLVSKISERGFTPLKLP
jgi:hypothetical protein